jgi:HD-like signal output (HDOD) protein
MRRILFVDDEPHILESLRDALRPRRREWSVAFADSGERALEELRRQPYEVVISDMRMPAMDGVELLRRVREFQPDTVRIILSGFAEAELVAQAAPSAHRFLAKPCDLDELARAIERSCALIDLTRQHDLRRAAAGVGALPLAPRLHTELTELIADPDAGVREAAAVVERDTVITGKVLQLANSGYFGLSRRVTRLEDAVAFLGLDALRALTLSIQAQQAFSHAPAVRGFSAEDVQRHAALVARLVRELLPDGRARDDAIAAALLVDIGLLVLASEKPAELADVLASASDQDRPCVEVEYERLGVTHAEVGAHLLALWDLPHAVVEAVAFHHRPLAAGDPAPPAVAVVHMADAIARDPEADVPELARLGDRVEAARAAARAARVAAGA